MLGILSSRSRRGNNGWWSDRQSAVVLRSLAGRLLVVETARCFAEGILYCLPATFEMLWLGRLIGGIGEAQPGKQRSNGDYGAKETSRLHFDLLLEAEACCYREKPFPSPARRAAA